MPTKTEYIYIGAIVGGVLLIIFVLPVLVLLVVLVVAALGLIPASIIA